MTAQDYGEPWRVLFNGGEVASVTRSDVGRQIANVYDGRDYLAKESRPDAVRANAHRIVACVNALRGIANPEALPALLALVHEMVETNDRPYHEMKRDIVEQLRALTQPAAKDGAREGRS